MPSFSPVAEEDISVERAGLYELTNHPQKEVTKCDLDEQNAASLLSREI